MVYKCYIAGCKTGYASDTKEREKMGKRKLSLFSVPQNEDKFQQWKKAISRTDRELGKEDRICELHFLPEEISRHFIHKMPDGKIVVIKRGRPVLMTDAVPTVFPNLTSSLSKNKIKKGFCKKRPLPKKTNRDNIDNIQPEENSKIFVHKLPEGEGKVIVTEKETDDADPTIILNLPSSLSKSKRNGNSLFKRKPLSTKVKKENTDTQLEEICTFDKTVPQFTFDSLLKNLSQVSKPHKLWAVSSHEDFIVCVKWNLNFIPEFKCHPERQIIVDANLNVKIMYHGCEVSIMSNAVIESVESLSLMLKEVDQYAVCPGAIKNKNCSVYLKRQFGLCGRPQKWCNGCMRNVSKKYLVEQNKSSPCFNM